MITVIAIGKKHETWVVDGIERYEKRLKQPFNTKWVLLPHSSLSGVSARQEESERILRILPPDLYIVLLDETGVQCDSPALTVRLQKLFVHSQQVVFIIGGAYGVTFELQQKADLVWSLSQLVFPHQLVRLLLIEQLYRAQEIARGTEYHHI